MTARTIPIMPNFFAGQKLTGTLMNVLGAYPVFWANPPMFRMFQSIAQAVATSTVTQITLDTSQFDSDSGRAGTSPYSYTIPVGMSGRWWFNWSIPWAATATNFSDAILYKNGSPVTGGTGAAAQNSDHMTPGENSTIPVNAGDTIALYGYQTTGGSLGTFTNSQYVPYLEGRLVSLATP